MLYEKISSTAQTIAFMRAHAGIPYADAIASLCGAKSATEAFYRRTDFAIDLARMSKLASWAMLRLYALGAAVRQTGILNVLELASGFSPVGLLLSEDLGVRYVETDLPQVVGRKQGIVRTILGGARQNLAFAPANALEAGDLQSAAALLSPGPLVITHEGLLQYLTHEEKLRVAANIRSVLQRQGGAWITSDIVLRDHFLDAFNASAYQRKVREILAENTGRDMVELAFTSFDEAELLFTTAGFQVKRYFQLDLAPCLLAEDAQRNRTHLKHQQIWVMNIA